MAKSPSASALGFGCLSLEFASKHLSRMTLDKNDLLSLDAFVLKVGITTESTSTNCFGNEMRGHV